MTNDINLLDPTLRPRKVLLPARQLAPALGLAVLALIGWAAWQSHEAGLAVQARQQLERRSAALQGEIRQLGEQVGSRKVSPEVQARAAAREALRAAREAAMATLRTENGTRSGGHARYLQALARQSVEGIWLTDVIITGAGRDIALRGGALDPELVADYLRRLGREEDLRGLAFNQLEFRRPPPVDPGAGTGAPTRYLEFAVTTLAGVDTTPERSTALPARSAPPAGPGPGWTPPELAAARPDGQTGPQAGDLQ